MFVFQNDVLLQSNFKTNKMSTEAIFYTVCGVGILLCILIMFSILFCNRDMPSDEQIYKQQMKEKNEKTKLD